MYAQPTPHQPDLNLMYLDVEMCDATVVQVLRHVQQLEHEAGGLHLVELRLRADELEQTSTGQPEVNKRWRRICTVQFSLPSDLLNVRNRK